MLYLHALDQFLIFLGLLAWVFDGVSKLCDLDAHVVLHQTSAAVRLDLVDSVLVHEPLQLLVVAPLQSRPVAAVCREVASLITACLHINVSH